MKEEYILSELVGRYPALESCKDDVREASLKIIDCYLKGGKLLVCGNGGSCSDADHIVSELMKSFEKKRPVDKALQDSLASVSGERGNWIADRLQNALPAISLNAHTALYSAISNDIDASLVFAQQVVGYGQADDVLFAISTSGNSGNVIDAAITARAKGLLVIGLTGESGGRMKEYCDVVITVPSSNTPEVQEFHLPVYHTICRIIEERFFQ
ncbi:MAG TPA: SIS domain-containing protein [Bacteroides sp.]|nr:SIS domain-containing protein [Bacteroides sp.]